YSVRPNFRAIWDAFHVLGDRDLVREALSSVVLVEVEVVGASAEPNLAEWHQAGVDQVPWDERYCSLERDVVLASEFGAPGRTDFALSFFLHCFTLKRALVTPWGCVDLADPVEDRPVHLKETPYSYPG